VSLSNSEPTSTAGRGAISGQTDRRILDAAYRQVMLVGFRRTTLTDVAERAGLSRMSLYRRYPDVTSVLQALMIREFSWIVEQARPRADDALSERQRIVAEAVSGLELISTNELFLRLLDVDPELLLPYITVRPGRFQDAAAVLLEEHLAAGMAEGSVRRDDPARIARSMLLAMRGFAFAARADWTAQQWRSALGDLARMLDGLLREAEQ
jgi:AcrR family transcriptional regulator